MCKELQKELLSKVVDGNCFKVCTPTHKSALIANDITIFNLFNINPVDYTYIKTTVEKLKNDGIKWIFIMDVIQVGVNVATTLKKKPSESFPVGRPDEPVWSTVLLRKSFKFS